MVFLNFQRFPSLNAGIFSSVTYLYSVSGLTPRYCEACRMFITSRESAAINVAFPRWVAGSPRPVGKSFCFLGGKTSGRLRVISGLIQEVNRELPVFTGVFGVSTGLVPFFPRTVTQNPELEWPVH